jgi:predicted helicase
VFNGRVLLEHAAEEIRAETSLDSAGLGVAVAVAAEVLHALGQASRRLEVPTADVPDLASMHAWSLRPVDRGTSAEGVKAPGLGSCLSLFGKHTAVRVVHSVGNVLRLVGGTDASGRTASAARHAPRGPCGLRDRSRL